MLRIDCDVRYFPTPLTFDLSLDPIDRGQTLGQTL